MDFEVDGLLGELEGEQREARSRLLRRLSEDGVSAEELRDAVKEDRLVLLPVERVLGGRLTAHEVEARAGLPAGMLLHVRRLQGLPDAGEHDRVFSEEDVEAARSTRLFLEAGLSEDAVTAISRVLGEAMNRLTDTVAANFVESFLKPGQNEDEVAMLFADLADRLAPAFGPVVLASYGAHLRDAVRRGMLGHAELEAGERLAVPATTVCFADLVGFTRLGWQVEAKELGEVATRLGDLAADLAEPPVRLVKTIGDAAMFISRDTEAMVGTALRLVDAVAAAGLPELRAGLSCGPALQRGGDFYGHAVNLASRVTGQARSGSVLCTQEVRDAAPEAFNWSFAGKHRLRGVSEPVALHRARVLPPPEDGARAHG